MPAAGRTTERTTKAPGGMLTTRRPLSCGDASTSRTCASCGNLLANDLDHGGTGGDGRLGLDGHLDCLELGTVGNGEHHTVLVASLGDDGTVHLEHGLAGNDLVALANVAGKALALQVDGVDTTCTRTSMPESDMMPTA